MSGSSLATVERKALAEAVAEYLQDRKHLSQSKNCERTKHSPVYEYNVAMWLNEFAGTFPGHAVCDLKKQPLDAYMGKFNELSAKRRNDRRAVVKILTALHKRGQSPLCP